MTLIRIADRLAVELSLPDIATLVCRGWDSNTKHSACGVNALTHSATAAARLSVCKLFSFSSISKEPLGQFQPNLAQSILGIQVCSNEGPGLFQPGDKYDIAKIHKPYILAQSVLELREFKFVQLKDHALFQGEISKKNM